MVYFYYRELMHLQMEVDVYPPTFILVDYEKSFTIYEIKISNNLYILIFILISFYQYLI